MGSSPIGGTGPHKSLPLRGICALSTNLRPLHVSAPLAAGADLWQRCRFIEGLGTLTAGSGRKHRDPILRYVHWKVQAPVWCPSQEEHFTCCAVRTPSSPRRMRSLPQHPPVVPLTIRATPAPTTRLRTRPTARPPTVSSPSKDG